MIGEYDTEWYDCSYNYLINNKYSSFYNTRLWICLFIQLNKI